MFELSRRRFLQASAAAASLPLLRGQSLWAAAAGPVPGERPERRGDITVENPRLRTPLSFIIDDSTCLVNLAHFAIPQFAQVFPEKYKQDWKRLPREIPDTFVEKFAGWCHEHGVRGKYSIVPFPACVGRLDRELPGWSRAEQEASLQLVRDVILPDWDIHPEMVTHTRVIDVRTGHPFPERTERYMENWRWADGRSVDELAEYLTYALQILKNVGLPCEGITTPGGFGNRVLAELAQATFQSVRNVYGAEIPHYFRHLYTDATSVVPRVEYAAGLNGPDPRCVVSIIGCTGDWFGGWDGLTPGSVDQFITEDGRGGRLPEVLGRGEPAVLVCHWPGIYYNGEEIGFRIFQEIVRRLDAHYDRLLWMKNSELARYWAAKELTSFTEREGVVTLRAPFATPRFTLRIRNLPQEKRMGKLRLEAAGIKTVLTPVERPHDLDAGDCWRDGRDVVACFDLPKGESQLRLGLLV
jgi:hypothetical protein